MKLFELRAVWVETYDCPDNGLQEICDKYEKVFFGFVNGHYPEWGYFSLEELEQTKGHFGLHIERDIHFKEQPFGQIKELQ